MRCLRHCLVALALAASAAPAWAHVEFQKTSAPAHKPFRATLVVGHGCSGSPTVRLRLRAPAGVLLTTAEPKAGWTIETKSGAFDAPVTIAGQSTPEGVVEIDWSGRLEPHDHGAFSLEMTLSDEAKPGQRIFFPVVQECERGVLRWIEPSEDGENAAPSLVVGPEH